MVQLHSYLHGASLDAFSAQGRIDKLCNEIQHQRKSAFVELREVRPLRVTQGGSGQKFTKGIGCYLQTGIDFNTFVYTQSVCAIALNILVDCLSGKALFSADPLGSASLDLWRLSATL